MVDRQRQFATARTVSLTAAMAALWLAHPLYAEHPASEREPRSADVDKPKTVAARLECMSKRAAEITPWLHSADERMPLKGRGEPLFRLVDPTRNYPDGTLWAWPEKGRPALFVTLSILSNSQPPRWLYEFVSFSGEKVGADYGSINKWSAERPGWEPHPFPAAAPTADSEPARLRQMRELARRFKAIELLPPPTEFELRLLPQPVLRYSDPGAGQLDGALFLLCHGTNPEILLLIEAANPAGKPSSWQYAFGRNTIAELRVTLDDREVWKQPYVNFTSAYADGPYSIATIPLNESESLQIER